MPTNSAIRPPPTSSATRRAFSPPANTPAAIAATEAAISPPASATECFATPDSGNVAPSRTAAIGGTRVARRAGMTLAATVTSVPTSSDTMIVRDATTVPASGRSAPSAANRAFMPLAMPSPSRMPDDRAMRPTITPSRTTERMTCLRDAPSVRNVANSRVR